MTLRTGAILAAVGSLALAVAALPQFRTEYAAVLFSRMPVSDQLLELAQGSVALPASVRAERIVLRACEDILRSPQAMFRPQETRTALTASCHDLAMAALRRAPVSSWAHLALAASAATDAEFAQAVVSSQATGGYEGELAQRRFALVADRIADAGPDLANAFTADIAVLAQTGVGTALLARRYAAYPELREVITTAIERAPEPAQRAFIAAVRRSGS
ncbi:MAG: hypothetical protein K0B00_03840 [Rhodobacteraceae bacterium]|nr:hypothetical protein [Paracoccaceae bacterium]